MRQAGRQVLQPAPVGPAPSPPGARPPCPAHPPAPCLPTWLSTVPQVGITTRVVIHQTWIAGPVGMSLALLAMQLTATTHPPGGATALIAATMDPLPKWSGYRCDARAAAVQ